MKQTEKANEDSQNNDGDNSNYSQPPDYCHKGEQQRLLELESLSDPQSYIYKKDKSEGEGEDGEKHGGTNEYIDQTLRNQQKNKLNLDNSPLLGPCASIFQDFYSQNQENSRLGDFKIFTKKPNQVGTNCRIMELDKDKNNHDEDWKYNKKNMSQINIGNYRYMRKAKSTKKSYFEEDDESKENENRGSHTKKLSKAKKKDPNFYPKTKKIKDKKTEPKSYDKIKNYGRHFRPAVVQYITKHQRDKTQKVKPILSKLKKQKKHQVFFYQAFKSKTLQPILAQMFLSPYLKIFSIESKSKIGTKIGYLLKTVKKLMKDFLHTVSQETLDMRLKN